MACFLWTFLDFFLFPLNQGVHIHFAKTLIWIGSLIVEMVLIFCLFSSATNLLAFRNRSRLFVFSVLALAVGALRILGIFVIIFQTDRLELSSMLGYPPATHVFVVALPMAVIGFSALAHFGAAVATLIAITRWDVKHAFELTGQANFRRDSARPYAS